MPGKENGSSHWLVDGQSSFESGVNSGQVPTIASESLPHGLKRSALAWLGNGTVRGGAITPRKGFLPLVQGINWSGLFQGAYMYEPDGGDPYIMMGVGGQTYQVRVDTDNSVHLVSAGATVRSAALPQWWMKQGERFLLFQDGVQAINVWDGNILQQITAMPNTLGAPTLPIGTAMDYQMGRMWVAGNGSATFGNREYMGGDIVRGPSGSVTYQLRDSILFQTENTYLATGGKFVVPTNAGAIRALAHTAELDTSLGQGRLYIGTRNSIYALNVPVTRTNWGLATINNLPLQTVAAIRFGPVGDRSVVPVNSDLFYQTLEPGIRSFTLATRYFQQWGNVGIDRNEGRVLDLNDRSLLRFSSGIEFDNRLLQTCLPFQTAVGVAHRGFIPLDFDIISTLDEKLPPAWEGMCEGLQFLQLLEGDFGGRQRAFAIVLGEVSGQIEVWEITSTEIRDNGPADNRITMWFETPAYTWGDQFKLKKLVSAEIWTDQLFGTSDWEVQYRVDASPCWLPWHQFRICAARNCIENAEIECALYPSQNACEQNRAALSLPVPPIQCDPNNKRPSNIGYQFQFRITIKGTATIRGLLFYAENVEKAPYSSLACPAANGTLNLFPNVSQGTV
jgi:hypothetical protein